MANNKLEYRKRREQGLRGQGDPFKPAMLPIDSKVTRKGWDAKKKKYVDKPVLAAAGDHVMGIGKTLVKVSRIRYRQRTVDRDYTKPNVEYRKTREKMPFKGHVSNAPNHKVKLPKHDPRLSNHERMLVRKKARDARREAETARRK